MNFKRIYFISAFILLCAFTRAQVTENNLKVNYAYSPAWWQTPINLPLSSRKVLVGKNGELMYEFPASKNAKDPETEFSTVINFQTGEKEAWKSQKLLKATVPLVITQKEYSSLNVSSETFTVAPLLFGTDDSTINNYLGTALNRKIYGQPGNDIMIVTLENNGSSKVTVNPSLTISTSYSAKVDTSRGKVFISDFLRVNIPYTIKDFKSQSISKGRNLVMLTLKPLDIEAGTKIQLAFGVSQGFTAIDCPNNIEQAQLLKKQTIDFWEKQQLPYAQISVPDVEIQNLLNASIRNIYQTIESQHGSVMINGGAAANRQVYISDAPFVIDALTMLNQKEVAGKGIDYLISLQKPDGTFEQSDKDWKATGYALWAISEYARLTGDKQWLESEWASLEKGFTYLINLTKKSAQESKAVYAGLVPPGYGSEGQGIDYVQNYWVLTGLNSAITAARWIGRNGQAIKWQSLYDDYYKAFQESVKKNMKKDSKGNLYLPVRATADKKVLPQKSQWSFMNAAYPGKIFDLEDPVLTGNMKMLANSLKEGLPAGTGWMPNGIVIPTASDYAHALQWTGKAQDATALLYAMANHASPNYAWSEAQSLKDVKDTLVSGDFPNSRSSAEFIRTLRHLLVMERSNELHLFEGVPSSWTKPGMNIKLDNILTDFGLLSFSTKFSDDGSKAYVEMNLDTTNRRTPQRILLHLDGIAGNPATMELELKPNLKKTLSLN